MRRVGIAMPHACLFGALPTESHPVRIGGTDTLWQRWERWCALSVDHFVGAPAPDGRIWRFVTAAGILDSVTVAGVWRLGRTRTGTALPLALMIDEAAPAASDGWYAAAETVLDVLGRAAPNADPERLLASLPPISSRALPDVAAVFWLDDWEVQELRFDTIHELATHGFERMLAPNTDLAG